MANTRKDIRLAGTLVALTLLGAAPAARAAGAGAPDAAVPPPAPAAVETAAPAAVPSAASKRRFDVTLSLLPMERGKYTSTPMLGTSVTSDASFAYGFALNVNARIIRGLSVGLAPQVIWNVQPKVNPNQLASPGASKEYDLLLRIAYTQFLVDGISVYAEALPGYSVLAPPAGKSPKGAVIAFGVGLMMDLTDRIFASIGGGYQYGFQAITVGSESAENGTRYVRLTLGAGFRF
ncbi:MAG TPA: hypothetical protein VHO67_07555 [Polyangia bacterium]|nr:hypothetical protein [Polyangia bacterium]